MFSFIARSVGTLASRARAPCTVKHKWTIKSSFSAHTHTRDKKLFYDGEKFHQNALWKPKWFWIYYFITRICSWATDKEAQKWSLQWRAALKAAKRPSMRTWTPTTITAGAVHRTSSRCSLKCQLFLMVYAIFYKCNILIANCNRNPLKIILTRNN